MAWGCSLRYRLLFGNHVSDMVLYGYLRAFCCRSRSDVPGDAGSDAITDPLTGIVADRKDPLGPFSPVAYLVCRTLCRAGGNDLHDSGIWRIG